MAIEYRFLPWTRRGLTSALQREDSGAAALPGRARVNVGLVVHAEQKGSATAAVTGGVGVRLYGPGDIIGLDSRLIVRIEPKWNATNLEPNYLAAIDFDPPDLPWMFTPLKPNGAQRLRPWLVLVVVDTEKVALPRLNSGAPLPSIKVAAAFKSTELPDLSQSWLWAHTQAVPDAGTIDPAALAGEMKASPAHNVSRLVCPRRLAPFRSYYACLVPAFEIGRRAGLGLAQVQGEPTLAPAWTLDASDVELPVYFHWEFSTGPQGDFETLARRLNTPKKISADPALKAKLDELKNLGTVPVGVDADRLLTADTKLVDTLFEGALLNVGATAAPVNKPVAGKLQTVLNSAEDRAANLAQGPSVRQPTLAPPIYGAWHARRHHLDLAADDAPRHSWLDELNLDPRYRLAAGYGTEVLRANQETFMQAAWSQLGEVLAAERLLNAGRLSRDVLAAAVKRHQALLPDARLIALLGPARSRIRLGPQETLFARIADTSLPNAINDAAMRRITSAQRPMLKAAVRRAAAAGQRVASVATQITQLTQTLAAATRNPEAIDPNRFVPDGILGSKSFDGVALPADLNQEVDLSVIGFEGKMKGSALQALQQSRQAALGKLSARARAKPRLAVALRRGIFGEAQVARIAQLQGLQSGVSFRAVADQIVKANVRGTEGVLLALDSRQDTPSFTTQALKIDGRNGSLVAVGARRTRALVGSIGAIKTTSLKRFGTSAVFATLPANTLPTAAVETPVAISAGGTGKFVGSAVAPAQVGVNTVTLAAPFKQREVLNQFSAAFADYAKIWTDPHAAASVHITPVDFPLAAAAAAARVQVDPRRVVPARISSLLTLAESPLKLDKLTGLPVSPFVGLRLSELADSALRYAIPRTFDRVMAYPRLDMPTYEYLARYDKNVFLPGVDQIPQDFILLLQTNSRFIESFMVGLNHEMGRELLWRGFPTDQRGTPFRRFWNRLPLPNGDTPPTDIEPIHLWNGNVRIGNQHGNGENPQDWLVLLVRGQLFKRFPNTIVYANQKGPNNTLLKPQPADPPDKYITPPMFTGRLEPDVVFFGFPITEEHYHEWCFVLEEHMTEPRFGFDEQVAGRKPRLKSGPGGVKDSTSWKDADWADLLTVAPGQHFSLQQMLNAPAAHGPQGLSASSHAGEIARALLQRPFRAYFTGDSLVVPING